MYLHAINFTLHGPNRDEDRNRLYAAAGALGRWAWLSESQFYLLTADDDIAAFDFLAYFIRSGDMLKIQQVCGPFALCGESEVVATLLLDAEASGIITLTRRSTTMLAVEAHRAAAALNALRPRRLGALDQALSAANYYDRRGLS